LKTVMRSVMNQERLGELLTLACERDLTDTIDLDEIVNPWSKLTKRGHLKKYDVSQQTVRILAKFLINDMNFHALCSILLQLTKSRSEFTFQWRVGLISRLHPPSQNQYVRPCELHSECQA
jgi:hypothetical protein